MWPLRRTTRPICVQRAARHSLSIGDEPFSPVLVGERPIGEVDTCSQPDSGRSEADVTEELLHTV